MGKSVGVQVPLSTIPESSELSPTGLSERRRRQQVCDENGENEEFSPFEKPYHGDAHKPLAKNEPYGLEIPLGCVEIFDFLRSL